MKSSCWYVQGEKESRGSRLDLWTCLSKKRITWGPHRRQAATGSDLYGEQPRNSNCRDRNTMCIYGVCPVTLTHVLTIYSVQTYFKGKESLSLRSSRSICLDGRRLWPAWAGFVRNSTSRKEEQSNYGTSTNFRVMMCSWPRRRPAGPSPAGHTLQLCG